MSKSHISKRVCLEKGRQKKIIISSKNKLGLTWNEFAEVLNISTRQLTEWKNENNSIPLNALQKIYSLKDEKLPKNIIVKEPYWHTKKAGQLGGQAVIKKYGCVCKDQKKRKEAWEKWWEEEGKFKENLITNKRLPFHKPRKSKYLAEMVGIILGDGGISERQISIYLHHKDDKEYIIFVSDLIEKLFHIKPSVYHKSRYSIKILVISRTELVDFFVQDLGLKIGNKIKQKVDIPKWIKKDDNFMTSCVRGLVDTDGSIFDHKYFSNGKQYCYKKLNFTSLSPPLLSSVNNHLKKIGIRSRIAREKDICIDSVADMKKYFSLINSHNQKHLKRYKK